ncbi:sensor histidine kinase [Bifidobacterium sp.]|jgi:two-component system sensor histidine kinase SenX3|uniref:sensor histidine kinase n=1 Tax=Bifidobacterium sp. TaxID=41200 RepID=UPI0025C0D456|nr:ATP-binding protein [Bifidobacterium sp.]MCH4209052.1 ATP-binding protein [Bifidobacterium sp.]MCI1225329.1 ATP-binding protein [Bifidobacterium sp.]
MVGFTSAQLVVLIALIAIIVAIALAWLVSSLRSRNDSPDAALPWGVMQGLSADEPISPHVVRRLIETMPDALIVCSAQGLVSYVSPGAAKLGLVEHSRLMQSELMDLLAQVASDGSLREREIAAGLGGQDMHVRVRIGAIDDDSYAVFLDDVSEQRHFEAVRRDFVTNVSHELKTPSGAIALLAETIGDAADDPEAVRYFAGRITKESERLTQLVRHLIDLQRVQDISAMQATQRVDALAAVREAVALNATAAQARDIVVRLAVDRRLVPLAVVADTRPDDPNAASDDPHGDTRYDVLADRESLTTAVRNLVENAIRYSPEHGAVAVSIDRAGDKVRICVVDQGLGIPKESQGRIFERFYRVDAARSRATGGSGLGLSIAKHGVEEHGGTLRVWSHEGIGSTFTIEMPSASAGNDDPASGEAEAMA